MKMYVSFFRMRFTNGLQYRAAAYAGIATQFAWGFMQILLFRAFYHSNAAAFPMTFAGLSSYIWLQQAFLALVMAWFMEADIYSAITSGNVAYELVRPMNLYTMWFVKNLASRLSKTVLRCMPILLVAAFLPAPFGLSAPAGWIPFIAFLFSMTAGFFVMVAFCMLVYISSFYTVSPLGVRVVAISLVEFLSGAIIPLPFLPDNIRRGVELLPFASIQNVPFLIYTGHLTGEAMLKGLGLQAFWLVALVVLGRAMMKNALKKVVVQGG